MATKSLSTGYGIPHDGADTTSLYPIKVGAVAYDYDGTDPSAVSAEGDRTHLKTNLQGALFVDIGNPRFFQTTLSWSAGATTGGAILGAPAAGLSLYITDIQLSSLTLCNYKLIEAATTTVYFQGDFGSTGGMHFMSFRQPIKVRAALGLNGTTSDKLHGINIQGYIAP